MNTRRLATALAVLAALVFESVAWSVPPSHAPAHGWRKKHDPDYVGYTGTAWPKDYGVVSGTCNREAVGAVLGGVVGGAIGSAVGEGRNRPIAIILGAVLGGVVGSAIGRDMDKADEACIAHSLELGRDRQPVRWTNPETGVSYSVTPTRGFSKNGLPCREFELDLASGRKTESSRGAACQSAEGEWKLMGR